MKILITGATGFIGSRLTLRCLEDGHSVRVLGQNRNPAEARNVGLLEERGAEVVIASVTERESLDRAHEGIEIVFHLAAAQHEANVPDQHFRDVNVEGTRNMLEASVAAGVRRFVHGSSIGVYGWTAKGPVADDSPLEPDNIYGVTKLAGEEVVRSFGDRIPWVILRISEVYGPGDRRLLKLFRGVQKGKFPMIGKGENLHHLIYIDDLIDGLLKSGEDENAVGKTFVLAGPAAVTTRDMVSAVARELGARPPRWRIPMTPMLLAARATEGILRPLGVQPPLHPRRMNFYRKSFSFSMEEARDAIGFSPRVGLEEGVRATARWYAEENLL